MHAKTPNSEGIKTVKKSGGSFLQLEIMPCDGIPAIGIVLPPLTS
jgi:hypothetical protein